MSWKSFMAITLCYASASIVVSCTGAIPISSPASGKIVVNDGTNATQSSGKSSDQSIGQNSSDGTPEADANSSAGADAGAGIDGAAGVDGATPAGAVALPTLRRSKKAFVCELKRTPSTFFIEI